jgi:histidyl-tRNA synthetase
MERLVSLVSSRFPVGEGRQKIFFASLGDHAQTQMLLFLIALRREGFEVVTDYDAKSLKSLLRQADRLGADYAVIVGDEELKQGAVQVKEMKEKGEQKNIPLESLVLYFQSKKPKGRMVL